MHPAFTGRTYLNNPVPLQKKASGISGGLADFMRIQCESSHPETAYNHHKEPADSKHTDRGRLGDNIQFNG